MLQEINPCINGDSLNLDEVNKNIVSEVVEVINPKVIEILNYLKRWY